MALIRRCLCGSEEEFGGILSIENLQLFSYKEIRAATNNFDDGNKLGRGGFGTVYKGVLSDGTVFAAKVLSSESEQGIKEFLAEIESITEVKHANLVRLLGCCVQRKNRILIYEYVENNSLDHALKGLLNGATNLTWSTRSDICVGTAKGLNYLHEEHEPSIVHRDIKASNVLLDRNYKPKIGDFGLAKLFPDNVTHISTGVVGTNGYLAPEYFVHGQLTKKADVYSFGVLLLEIISGKRISQTIRSETFLVREAWVLYKQGRGRLLEMVDASMGPYPEEEVLWYIRVGLSCTQAAPSSRPTMRQVVAALSRPVAPRDDLDMRPPSFADDHGGHRATTAGPQLHASPKARWPEPAPTPAPAACSGSVRYSEVVPR
ncbi:hypothetical protein ACP4OV_000541 [Aristida adscensionis]